MHFPRGPRRLGGATVLLALVMILASCGGPAATAPSQPSGASPDPQQTPSGSAEGGGVLVVGQHEDARSLDPGDSPNVAAIVIAGIVAESLYRMNMDTFEPVPWLAESAEASEDGMTWRVQLKDGIQFHDGTPFNAEAVAFTIGRYVDPEHPYAEYGAWGLAKAVFGNVASVEAVDELTVEFGMVQPFSPLLVALASPLSSIVSPTAVMADPENYNANPVGTGAFSFVEWQRDDRVVLERFDNYWAGPAELDGVVFRVIPDNSARVLALQNGEIHVMTSLDATAADVMESDSALRLDSIPQLQGVYLSMNHDKERMADVRVREAIYSAINRQALVDSFFPGGTVAAGVMSPQLLGFDDSIEWPAYDPERARELLADAGFADGFTTDLVLQSAPLPSIPEPQQTAEAIQADLAAVGIEAQVELLEGAAFSEKVKNGDFELSISGYSPLLPDPWTIMFTQFDSRRATPDGSANNYAYYRNPEVDELNDLATATSDPEERADFYRQIQQILREDVVRVDIAHVDQVYGVRAEVEGFVPAPLTFYLEDTSIGAP